jgi:hypothetical protein
MDIHALSIQTGTSIGMIKHHYSHLTPQLKKDILTGAGYEPFKDEYAAQTDLTKHDTHLLMSSLSF